MGNYIIIICPFNRHDIWSWMYKSVLSRKHISFKTRNWNISHQWTRFPLNLSISVMKNLMINIKDLRSIEPIEIWDCWNKWLNVKRNYSIFLNNHILTLRAIWIYLNGLPDINSWINLWWLRQFFSISVL